MAVPLRYMVIKDRLIPARTENRQYLSSAQIQRYPVRLVEKPEVTQNVKIVQREAPATVKYVTT